ncbi:MAG: hypothetical protein J2P47_03820 [Acetobacteraceae bacterium]|nr:hypothetical protein [Acetobacteraceae bacterium]
MTALETLVETLTEHVVKIFEENGELVPMWLLETDDGKLIAVMTPILDPGDKDQVVFAIRVLLKKYKAVRYAVGIETWFANESPETFKNAPMPSERADRKEGIVISAEDHNGETYGVLREIDRSNGTITLKPAEQFSANFGRFVGLLKEYNQ